MLHGKYTAQQDEPGFSQFYSLQLNLELIIVMRQTLGYVHQAKGKPTNQAQPGHTKALLH